MGGSAASTTTGNLNSWHDQTVGKIFTKNSGLGFINNSSKAAATGGTRLVNNMQDQGVFKGLGMTIGEETGRISSDITGPLKEGMAGPQDPVKEAPAALTQEQIIENETAARKKARREEEIRLLTEHPGRGGTILTSSPSINYGGGSGS